MTNSLRLNNQNQNSLRVWKLIGSAGGGNTNTVSISLSAKKSDGTNFPAGIYEKGTTYDNVVFDMKVTPLKPTESPITSAKLYKDDIAVQTFIPSTSVTTYTYTAATVDNSCTYKGEAKTAKQTVVSNLKYIFVDPMFYGTCDTTPITDEIIALTKLVKAKGKVTCNYTSNSRVCFCYPKEYGALTSILDDMKFEYIYAFEQTEVSLTLHGTSVAYYVYTTIDEAMIDNFNYTFIF